MADRREEIASKLRELMELSTLDEGPQSFRARAYENAMHEISSTPSDVEGMTEKELTKLPGIGKSTAKRIREYLETGKITKLEELRVKYPAEYVRMSKIPGLGPKSLKRLREELGIENLEDLKRAIEEQKIRELPGFGEKSEEKIAKAIERMGVIGKDVRHPIARTAINQDSGGKIGVPIAVTEAWPKGKVKIRAVFSGSSTPDAELLLPLLVEGTP